MFLLQTSSQRSKGFHLILVWVQLQRKLFSFSCAMNSVKLHSDIDFIWGKGDTHIQSGLLLYFVLHTKHRHYFIFLFFSPLFEKYKRPECQCYPNHTPSILTQIMGKGLASGVSFLGFLYQKRSSHHLRKRSTSVPDFSSGKILVDFNEL